MSVAQAVTMEEAASIRDQYAVAFNAHLATGEEETLMQAYDVARNALQAGISLGDFGLYHHASLRDALSQGAPSEHVVDRAEAFYLEAIAVYDLALRGYRTGVDQLSAEIAERRRVEEELRDITFELARQRDTLEATVESRTQEINARATELEETVRRLDTANTHLSEFSYALSHSLKTPINAVNCLIEIVEEDFGARLDPDLRHIVKQLQDNSARMLCLIGDVVDYSRVIGQGINLRPVDLNPMLREIAQDLSPDVTSCGGVLEIAPLPTVLGDAGQLRMVFSHLIENAIRFRDREKALVISVSALPGNSPDEVTLRVADNGIGIPEQHRARIFGLFRRLHAFEDIPGSGVGLSLCERVAENHGSEINIAESDDGGAVFLFNLRKKEKKQWPFA